MAAAQHRCNPSTANTAALSAAILAEHMTGGRSGSRGGGEVCPSSWRPPVAEAGTGCGSGCPGPSDARPLEAKRQNTSEGTYRAQPGSPEHGPGGGEGEKQG